MNRKPNRPPFCTLSEEKGTTTAALGFSVCNNQTRVAPPPPFSTTELDELDRTGKKKLHRRVHAKPPLPDEVLVSVTATSHGIHSTSEAGQLYSYCILNYQDSGFLRDPRVFKRPLSPSSRREKKRMRRIQSITLCTYGLRHFKRVS